MTVFGMPAPEPICKRLFGDSAWIIKCLVGTVLPAVRAALFRPQPYL